MKRFLLLYRCHYLDKNTKFRKFSCEGMRLDENEFRLWVCEGWGVPVTAPIEQLVRTCGGSGWTVLEILNESC